MSDKEHGSNSYEEHSSNSLTSFRSFKKVIESTTKAIFSDDGHSYKELVKIEKRRRAILKRKELPIWRLLLFWDGTVLKALSTNILFYSTVCIFVVLRVLTRLEIVVVDFGSTDVAVIGGFLSFFLVLFASQANSRFDMLYTEATSCIGRCFDVSCLARELPEERRLRLVRYLNAAYAAAFVGLNDTYNFNNFFKEVNEKCCLLTQSEIERMIQIDMDNGGSACRELITWCIHEVQDAKNEKLIDIHHAGQMRDHILRLRGAMGTIYDWDDQPISFFYLHFLCLLSACYLPLFAASVALSAGGPNGHWLRDIVAGLIVVVQAIFVIGLRLIGQKMSNPFGDDVEDLSVMTYVISCWQACVRILYTPLPGPRNYDREVELHKHSESVGEAWKEPLKDIGYSKKRMESIVSWGEAETKIIFDSQENMDTSLISDSDSPTSPRTPTK